jgi:hypothetical protein
MDRGRGIDFAIIKVERVDRPEDAWLAVTTATAGAWEILRGRVK